MTEPNLASGEPEGTDAEAYSQRIQRRKAIQDRRMAETVTDRGLVALRVQPQTEGVIPQHSRLT